MLERLQIILKACTDGFGDRLVRLLTTSILFTICLTAIGQTSPTKKEKWIRVDSLFTKDGKRQRTPTHYSYVHVDTEIKYTDSIGNSVIIQNSGPRGGRRFTDATGIRFGYRVFWTRVINETATLLELTITFPADSFPLPSPDSYMKVFLHPDTATQSMTQYGETTFDDGRKQFEDTTLLKSFCHIPTRLQRTIHPKEAYLFYTVVLRHHQRNTSSPRAGFVLKEHDLFYKVNPELDELIPCGRIVLKQKK